MANIIKLIKDMYTPEDLINDVKKNMDSLNSILVVADYKDNSAEILHTGVSLQQMGLALIMVMREALLIAESEEMDVESDA